MRKEYKPKLVSWFRLSDRWGVIRPDGKMHPWRFDTKAEAQEFCDFENKPFN